MRKEQEQDTPETGDGINSRIRTDEMPNRLPRKRVSKRGRRKSRRR